MSLTFNMVGSGSGQSGSVSVEPLSVSLNGTYTAPSGTAYSPVNVNVPSSSAVTEKDVNFIDYDGTLLYSYTAEEANALTALPSNPSHAGLTAQGWNWTLADIKAQLANVGDTVWVGQMYVTSSGDTEIDVSMPDGRLSPTLTICVNGTITVDWGDGTTPDTVTGSAISERQSVPHVYASAGDYTIVAHAVSGNYGFYGDGSGTSSYLLLRKALLRSQNWVYSNCVRAIRLGSGVSISDYAFAYCRSLKYVTISSDVASIGQDAFYNCRSMIGATIPRGITTIDQSTFEYCGSLKAVAIPKTVTGILNYAFGNCFSLSKVTIPNVVTTVAPLAFTKCESLTSVVISGAVSTIANSAFLGASSLRDVTLPNSVTIIDGYAFQNCYSLANISIPDSVTSIGVSAFESCSALAEIVIPANVTSIGNYGFRSCSGASAFFLKPTTPPTLGGTSVFDSISSECVFYVPYSSDHSVLTAYQSASNWSTYASQMQEEQA